MINLLPPGVKAEVAYARRNNGLLRYCFFMLVVMAGIVAITGFGVLYMQNSKNAYEDQVDRTAQSLKAQNLDSVQKQAEEMSGNIKLATGVLSRQILFSKLLRQIGASMPADTSLSDLKIIKGDLGITLTAVATNYNSASQVQVNLSDPANKIFTKADLVSISCESNNKIYPCTVVIRALFGDDSSYKFINSSKAKS